MEETQHNTTTEQAASNKKGGRSLGGIVIAIIIIALLGLGYFYFFADKTPQTQTTAETIGLVDTKATGPVARVNNEEVERPIYNSLVINLTNVAEAQGLDVADATIQTEITSQAMTSLVNSELLLQAATESGITVDDATTEAEYDALVAQAGGKEVLEARLNEARITESMLRVNVEEQLVVNQYLDTFLSAQNVTVTDAEVTSFYDSLVAQVAEGTDVPAMAEVRTELEQQLIAEKQQAAVETLIESLRSNASIEILI